MSFLGDTHAAIPTRASHARPVAIPADATGIKFAVPMRCVLHATAKSDARRAPVEARYEVAELISEARADAVARTAGLRGRQLAGQARH